MNPLLLDKYKEIISEVTNIPVADLKEWRLNAIWETIINYIGYDPVIQDREQELRGNGQDRLYLACRPVRSIIELLINGSLIEQVDFRDNYLKIFTKKGHDYLDYTMYEHCSSDYINVKYVAGYDEEDLPINMIIAGGYLYSDMAGGGTSTEELESYKIDTITYKFRDNAKSTSKDYKSLLKQFKGV